MRATDAECSFAYNIYTIQSCRVILTEVLARSQEQSVGPENLYIIYQRIHTQNPLVRTHLYLQGHAFQ